MKLNFHSMWGIEYVHSANAVGTLRRKQQRKIALQNEKIKLITRCNVTAHKLFENRL